MYIYSRYKSYKNPPFLTKQRVFLVRPMRFERTAFGVGGVCCDYIPADYCFESTVSDSFPHIIVYFSETDTAENRLRTPKMDAKPAHRDAASPTL